LKEGSSHHWWMHHERVVEYAPIHSSATVKWSGWAKGTWREREGGRSEEWIGEGSRWTEQEGIVEWIYGAEERVEEFERVGKSEDVGVERLTSGVVL